MKAWTLVVAALVLAGCGTTGKSIQTELVIRDNVNCTINLYPMLETSSGDNATTSANKTDTLLKDLIKLPDQISAATNALEGAISGAAASGILAEVVDAVEPVNPSPVVNDSGNLGEGLVIETITMKIPDGQPTRRFGWFLENGDSYGDGFTISLGSCGSLRVDDPGLDVYSIDPNLGNGQMLYFSGNSFSPGTPECSQTGQKCRAAVWTQPGCITDVATVIRQ